MIVDEQMEKELRKFQKLAGGVPIKLTKETMAPLCASGLTHYKVGSVPIGFCEKCAKQYLKPMKPLIEQAGGVFFMSVYSLVAESRISEGRLKRVKDWTPEDFEEMRDLCCESSADHVNFGKIFLPDYMGV